MDRQAEAARQSGRTGYRKAARQSVGLGGGLRLALWAYNRLRISAPLAQQTADRFEILLLQGLVMRDLDSFIDTRIRRIHGRRVADLLHELLNRRREMIEQALDGLRLQYPGYAEELERRFIRRTALRLERQEYAQLHEEGLIGDEVFADLEDQLDTRFNAVAKRPKLDIAVRKADLARQFPLFGELDEATLKRLSRALTTRYVNEGDLILARGRQPDRVYFIASGAVELRTAAATSHRLGRGELFGQLSMLNKSTARTEVRAIAPSTLLTLEERRFRRLLRRSVKVQQAVRESAEKRNISVPYLDELAAKQRKRGKAEKPAESD